MAYVPDVVLMCVCFRGILTHKDNTHKRTQKARHSEIERERANKYIIEAVAS